MLLLTLLTPAWVIVIAFPPEFRFTHVVMVRFTLSSTSQLMGVAVVKVENVIIK